MEWEGGAKVSGKPEFETEFRLHVEAEMPVKASAQHKG